MVEAVHGGETGSHFYTCSGGLFPFHVEGRYGHAKLAAPARYLVEPLLDLIEHLPFVARVDHVPPALQKSEPGEGVVQQRAAVEIAQAKALFYYSRNPEPRVLKKLADRFSRSP